MSTREESEPGKPPRRPRRADTGRRPARDLAEALREAMFRLTRGVDGETVPATLLECLRGVIRFDRAQAMLVGEASRLSVRAVFDGERVVALPAGERPEIDADRHPILRDVLSTAAVVVIDDVRVVAGWRGPSEAVPEESWMGVPLVARGEVAGLFTLSRAQPRAFDEDDIRVAEAMASLASVTVDNAVLNHRMEASKAHLQWLSRRLVEAQERERRHVARELHDEAGQALASLRFGLRLLEREVAEGGDVGARVTELLRTTDAVIDGLHRLAADLRPASLDHLGLDAALRQHARQIAATHGLHVRFKARGFTGERLPPVVETALFRVVQEAVTNVVRHAKARRVDVLLEHRGDRVLAMIEDDGIGFDPDRAQSGERFGLIGLRERAEALDGTLTVESAPGAGTTVVVEVASADPHPDR